MGDGTYLSGCDGAAQSTDSFVDLVFRDEAERETKVVRAAAIAEEWWSGYERGLLLFDRAPQESFTISVVFQTDPQKEATACVRPTRLRRKVFLHCSIASRFLR